MSSSDLSELTSNVSSDDEAVIGPVSKGKLDHYFKHGSNVAQATPTLKKKRPPSPPHEYVLADNSDIAFIVMFRSRFSDAFQKSLPHYGPQDIENGVVGSIPGEQMEKVLCALLGLVLNRKKDIERGHYTRALEEAIHAHANQWPSAWQGKNPLHGGGSFNNMTPKERLTLMKTLIIWSLDSSDAVKAIIKESYKPSRHDDDLNQPLSVQSWGKDGDKRRFWLIEGQDDTHFRLYRESNPALKTVTWRSLAGEIDEIKQVAEKLGEENTQASRRLRDRIVAAIPRFEASEEKRKRRDYRLARRAQFTRPEPGFSLYEGRTRGKRMRYTYSDEEDAASDAVSTRRSNRQSGVSTPGEPARPIYTASGRQVKSRHGGAYGETMLSADYDQGERGEADTTPGVELADDEDEDPISRGRPRRAEQSNMTGRKPRRRDDDDMGSSEQSDDASNVTSSGNEWQGGGDDDDEVEDLGNDDDNEDLELSDEGLSEDELARPERTLVVQLRYAKGQSSSPLDNAQPNGTLKAPLFAAPGPPSKDTDVVDAPPMAPQALPNMPQVNGTAYLGHSTSSLHASLAPPHNRALENPHQSSASSRTSQAEAPIPTPRAHPAFNPHAYVYEGKTPIPKQPPPSGQSSTIPPS